MRLSVDEYRLVSLPSFVLFFHFVTHSLTFLLFASPFLPSPPLIAQVGPLLPPSLYVPLNRTAHCSHLTHPFTSGAAEFFAAAAVRPPLASSPTSSSPSSSSSAPASASASSGPSSSSSASVHGPRLARWLDACARGGLRVVYVQLDEAAVRQARVVVAVTMGSIIFIGS